MAGNRGGACFLIFIHPTSPERQEHRERNKRAYEVAQAVHPSCHLRVGRNEEREEKRERDDSDCDEKRPVSRLTILYPHSTPPNAALIATTTTFIRTAAPPNPALTTPHASETPRKGENMAETAYVHAGGKGATSALLPEAEKHLHSPSPSPWIVPSSPPKEGPARPSIVIDPTILVAMHDFGARSPDELTLHKGEQIEVLERDGR